MRSITRLNDKDFLSEKNENGIEKCEFSNDNYDKMRIECGLFLKNKIYKKRKELI